MARFHQILLVCSILWLSWLAMMLVHECGHVLGARVTGGEVRRVVWHPAVLSRTDVQPNPHPLIEVWAGPVFGSTFPIGVAWAASYVRLRIAYLSWFIAGFCLIANGAYIGIGAIRPIGDAKELMAHGMPAWPMGLFGLLAVVIGFWIWHRVSHRLGFGHTGATVAKRHAWLTLLIAALMTAAGIVFGDRGN